MKQIIYKEDNDWIKYECMLTCGRVLISPDLSSYALRCKFCATICLRPKMFVSHINEQHKDTIKQVDINCLQEVVDHVEGVELNELEFVEVLPESESIEEVNSQTNLGQVYDCLDENQEDACERVPNDDEDYLPESEEHDSSDDDSSSNDLESTSMEYSDDLGDKKDDIDLNDMSKKALFLSIIERFKEKPELWNNKHTMFARRHHKRVLVKNMAADLNEHFNMNLTPSKIRKIFIGLRRLFYAEVQLSQNQTRTGDGDSQLWCYKALSFLNKSKQKSHKMLTEQMRLLIARHYKTNRLLWDRQHKLYHNRAQRGAIVQKIVNAINVERNDTDFTPITVHEFLLCVQRLRMICTSNKKALMKSSTTDAKCEPPYPAFVKPLDFLNAQVGPYVCEVCGETTLNYNRHRTHVNSHNNADNDSGKGRKRYTCDICGKELKNTTTLRLHKRTHTGESPYECTVCDRKFTNSSGLRVHSRVHTGERPYVCDVCGKTFRTCSFLLRHKLFHNPEKFRFKCNLCKKAFGDRKRLREHMNSHLNRREFLCDFCGKGFYASKTLRQHELLHKDSKRYSCELCGETFAQCAGLYSHMKRTHRMLQLNGNDADSEVDVC